MQEKVTDALTATKQNRPQLSGSEELWGPQHGQCVKVKFNASQGTFDLNVQSEIARRCCVPADALDV